MANYLFTMGGHNGVGLCPISSNLGAPTVKAGDKVLSVTGVDPNTGYSNLEFGSVIPADGYVAQISADDHSATHFLVLVQRDE
jgi:hypothetical protein